MDVDEVASKNSDKPGSVIENSTKLGKHRGGGGQLQQKNAASQAASSHYEREKKL
jgi:hypothetical protein